MKNILKVLNAFIEQQTIEIKHLRKRNDELFNEVVKLEKENKTLKENETK